MTLQRLLKKVFVKLRRITGRTSFATTIYDSKYRVDLDEFIDWAAYSGTFEPETEQILEKLVKPGMTAIDIGANTGLYVLLMAKLVGKTGKVYAFEPTTYGFNRLSDNISLNSYQNIFAHKLGLSDKTRVQEVELASSYPIKRVNGKFHSFHGGKLVKEHISFVTLDSFNLKPDFILMDTDGYERHVLNGAMETLKHRPIIVFELLDQTLKEKGSSAEEVITVLEDNGYQLFNIDMTPLTSGISSNVVAVPRIR